MKDRLCNSVDCEVVEDLIIVPFGPEVMAKWLGWRQNRVEAVLWIL